MLASYSNMPYSTKITNISEDLHWLLLNTGIAINAKGGVTKHKRGRSCITNGERWKNLLSEHIESCVVIKIGTVVGLKRCTNTSDGILQALLSFTYLPLIEDCLLIYYFIRAYISWKSSAINPDSYELSSVLWIGCI